MPIILKSKQKYAKMPFSHHSICLFYILKRIFNRMFDTKGFSGVMLDVIKSERLVMLGPIVFINFFAVGYILHGVAFAFQALDLSQILIAMTISISIFFGEMVLLLIPTKVIVDHKMIPDLKRDREIIRMSFDDQDREIFKRVKLASNSIIMIFTGLINYFLMAFFLLLWYSNNGQPVPLNTVINGLIPVYLFFFTINVVAGLYDMIKGSKTR